MGLAMARALLTSCTLPANNGQGESTLDHIDLWATIPHRKLVKLQHVDNEASTFPR